MAGVEIAYYHSFGDDKHIRIQRIGNDKAEEFIINLLMRLSTGEIVIDGKDYSDVGALSSGWEDIDQESIMADGEEYYKICDAWKDKDGNWQMTIQYSNHGYADDYIFVNGEMKTNW